MKMIKSLVTLTLIICTATAVQAQQQQEEKSIKPLPASSAKPASANTPSPVAEPKPIVADAIPVTKPSSDQAKPEDMKGQEIKPGTQKGMPVQNADRPKPSTIETPKQSEAAQPASKPKPLIAVPADN